MKPDPRGDRLHPQGSGGVDDAEAVEGDELDDGSLVGREPPERRVHLAGLGGRVDPLLGRGDGVVLERPTGADPAESPAFPGPLPEVVGDHVAGDPEEPRHRWSAMRVVGPGPVDGGQEDVGDEVRGVVRVGDTACDEPVDRVEMFAVEGLERVWSVGDARRSVPPVLLLMSPLRRRGRGRYGAALWER